VPVTCTDLPVREPAVRSLYPRQAPSCRVPGTGTAGRGFFQPVHNTMIPLKLSGCPGSLPGVRGTRKTAWGNAPEPGRHFPRINHVPVTCTDPPVREPAVRSLYPRQAPSCRVPGTGTAGRDCFQPVHNTMIPLKPDRCRECGGRGKPREEMLTGLRQNEQPRTEPHAAVKSDTLLSSK
jgi:hypothetical protein